MTAQFTAARVIACERPRAGVTEKKLAESKGGRGEMGHYSHSIPLSSSRSLFTPSLTTEPVYMLASQARKATDSGLGKTIEIFLRSI